MLPRKNKMGIDKKAFFLFGAKVAKPKV